MSEKKYCGDAKQNQYGFNCKISFNQLIKHIYEATQNNEVLTAFTAIKKAVSGKNLPFVNEWVNKEGKPQIEFKIQANGLKEPTKYKTHAISLNEFVPTPQNNTPEQGQPESDKDEFELPF